MTWVDAAAAIVTKKFYEDAKLTRPMHVIAGQRISLFLVFVFSLLTYLTSTESFRTHYLQLFRECAVATNQPCHHPMTATTSSRILLLDSFIVNISFSVACCTTCVSLFRVDRIGLSFITVCRYTLRLAFVLRKIN